MKEFDITTALHEDGCVKGGSSCLGVRVGFREIEKLGREVGYE